MSISVSIVEDDAEALKILSDWIKSAKNLRFVSGYRSAERAAVRLPSEKPDVVLMDINLLGISGIECVRQLKPILTDTQFLMLTVYEDSDYLFSALAAGASGYLLKRSSREELIHAIEDLHSGGSPLSSNIARKLVQSFMRNDIGSGGVEDLTPREHEVLKFLASGHLYKEIAEHLGVTITTINAHVRSVYMKLQVRSRGQAVAKIAHLLPPDLSRRPSARPR
jgi:DNA-binding NarL/FixJ family response regulator